MRQAGLQDDIISNDWLLTLTCACVFISMINDVFGKLSLRFGHPVAKYLEIETRLIYLFLIEMGSNRNYFLFNISRVLRSVVYGNCLLIRRL